jgi:S-adenosylmethionine hydrolase
VAIVTLTTDFGDVDGYAGAMKGVILSGAPSAVVVDISHAIRRHDVVAAAHVLASAAPYFPPGSIHVAVVDPGVGGARKGVVVAAGEQLFVGPDNGIFSLVAPRPQAVHEITAFRHPQVSSTFHGRDVFAVAAAHLAAGAALDQAGPPVVLRGALPRLADGHHVVHVDVYGNLITDIPGHAARGVRVAGRAIDRLSQTYESVAAGELLAYVGSRGTIEIAVREGSAAELLQAARGTPVEVL